MFHSGHFSPVRDDLSHLGYDGLVGAAHDDGVQHPDSAVPHQSGGDSSQGRGEQSISEQIMGSLRPLAQGAVPTGWDYRVSGAF